MAAGSHKNSPKKPGMADQYLKEQTELLRSIINAVDMKYILMKYLD